jgi:hypothetical protein
LESEKFKLSDLLNGLVIPLIVGIIIVAFPAILRPILDSAFPPGDMMAGTPDHPFAFITVILTHGFSSMIILAVPLILGLTWNKWAGGAAGFLMGSLYYVAFAGYNTHYSLQIAADAALMSGDPNVFIQFLPPNLWADPSFIGNWIVGGILIGYIAGALNNRSTTFKRMLGAGLTASIAVAILQFVLNMTVASGAWMAQDNPGFALFTVMLPGIILGIIAPIVAKVMTWYGLQPLRH